MPVDNFVCYNFVGMKRPAVNRRTSCQKCDKLLFYKAYPRPLHFLYLENNLLQKIAKELLKCKSIYIYLVSISRKLNECSFQAAYDVNDHYNN